MQRLYHSVTLNKAKCKGCTNCMKQCPTQAIRVRNGKAKIIPELCIDCGRCIDICPYRAKGATIDQFDRVKDFQYKIALPAPALYGQFKGTPSINLILTGLKRIGFDRVYEVALAAQMITAATREYINSSNYTKPIISSACPTIVRLIAVRFPSLAPNILPLYSPMELAARLAKEEAVKETGLKPSEIGVFFITPCPAKATYVKEPFSASPVPIDGCISIRDVYLRLISAMPKVPKNEIEELSVAGFDGASWARNGGESYGLDTKKRIAVDGIMNVIKVFEEIEDGQLDDTLFIEASSCTGGCIGGPLTVENTFVAKTRVQNLALEKHPCVEVDEKAHTEFKFALPTDAKDIINLDRNVSDAIQKMEQVNRLCRNLPGLDCGSCGAPGCHALAEDIVKGYATEMSCVFKLREKVINLAQQMLEIEKGGWGQGNK